MAKFRIANDSARIAFTLAMYAQYRFTIHVEQQLWSYRWTLCILIATHHYIQQFMWWQDLSEWFSHQDILSPPRWSARSHLLTVCQGYGDRETWFTSSRLSSDSIRASSRWLELPLRHRPANDDYTISLRIVTGHEIKQPINHVI